jgi:hypothetical protein
MDFGLLADQSGFHTEEQGKKKEHFMDRRNG